MAARYGLAIRAILIDDYRVELYAMTMGIGSSLYVVHYKLDPLALYYLRTNTLCAGTL